MPRGKKKQQVFHQHLNQQQPNTFLQPERNDLQRPTNGAKISWSSNSDQVDENSIVQESVDSFDEQQEWNIEPRIVSFVTKQLDYPTDAFKGIPQTDLTRRDTVIQDLVGGLGCWDARHFLHIAEFGYTWESCLAFFLFDTGPYELIFCHAFRGVVLNNIIFVVNGLLLFRLAYILTGSLKEAIISVYIFCWSPASIFFSAVYSESLYMLFTFSAILFLQYEPNNRVRQILVSFILSFAFLTRSNGLTNIGYIGFHIMLEVVLRKSSDGKLEFEELNLNFFLKVFSKLPFLLLCFCIMVLPLRLFGFTVEEKFCTTSAAYQDERVVDYIQNANVSFVLPGNVGNMTWCSKDKDPAILMPAYYTEVQEKYWGVSLFGYWRLRKIPFF
uniref:GPI mannosyltransferase 2 n=1 Tax=Ditylenchus dipsaci TaxID=166011 RepID=A0A915DDD6_9BILA